MISTLVVLFSMVLVISALPNPKISTEVPPVLNSVTSNPNPMIEPPNSPQIYPNVQYQYYYVNSYPQTQIPAPDNQESSNGPQTDPSYPIMMNPGNPQPPMVYYVYPQTSQMASNVNETSVMGQQVYPPQQVYYVPRPVYVPQENVRITGVQGFSEQNVASVGVTSDAVVENEEKPKE